MQPAMQPMEKRLKSSGLIRALVMGLATVAAVPFASGQGTSNTLSVKAVAETELQVVQNGRESSRLVPAERVVPGDQVLYTLEIRNTGRVTVKSPVVVYAVPDHMAYVADSATGPGAEVSFSIDGGFNFDVAENLRRVLPDGLARPANAIDYTHIRWKLRNDLKSKSVAYARFRAVVK